MSDIIPSVRDLVIFIVGASSGAFILLLWALCRAVALSDRDIDEWRRGRRS